MIRLYLLGFCSAAGCLECHSKRCTTPPNEKQKAPRTVHFEAHLGPCIPCSHPPHVLPLAAAVVKCTVLTCSCVHGSSPITLELRQRLRSKTRHLQSSRFCLERATGCSPAWSPPREHSAVLAAFEPSILHNSNPPTDLWAQTDVIWRISRRSGFRSAPEAWARCLLAALSKEVGR